MAEWQPIESAPRDGSLIDLWIEHPDGGYRAVNCHWGAKFTRAGDEIAEFLDAHYNFINAMKSRITGEWLIRPTHWMPLPAPPKES